jgi:hypothetical protein
MLRVIPLPPAYRSCRKKKVNGGIGVFPRVVGAAASLVAASHCAKSNVAGGGGLSSSDHAIMSYKIRSLSKETAFWSAFGLWFTFAPVLVRVRSEKESTWERFDAGGDGEVFVFVARRRYESFSWTVPEDDAELLEGVEARGSQERKSDDGFESFLLMNVG